jgi:hypothetical protein
MAKGFSGADAGGPFRRKPPLPLGATASPRMGGRMGADATCARRVWLR